MTRLFTQSFEALRFAWIALVGNRLRTFLSLLGITIGILAIISVYAIVDSLEKSIRNSVEGLGSDVVYVQKWPWGGGGEEYAWWKYFQRKDVDYDDFMQLTARGVASASDIVLLNGSNGTITHDNSNVENAQIRGVSHGYARLNALDISAGRYFSTLESRNGRSICLLGADIADALFLNEDPVGKKVKAFGREYLVLGVIKRQGASLVGENSDEMMMVPAVNLIRIIGKRSEGSAIQIKVKKGLELAALKEDIRMQMRAIRRLRPRADDDFSLNDSSTLSSGLDSMFSVIGALGTVIGGFSILVGGFGIANIMFVSVRERTGQIGIQKALGATKYFVLSQFLFESIMLSLVGGVAGILLVALLMWLGSMATGFALVLSTANVITGLLISVAIGLIAGIAPAIVAANMEPVDAIRFNQ
ncbi:MAG: FtsX-like permease family protein [Flavobacteriales bacterium]|nr:FtsX-like permease family protein [Flavobacteriales bacterium]